MSMKTNRRFERDVRVDETSQATRRGMAESKSSSGSEGSPKLSSSPDVRSPDRKREKGRQNVCRLFGVRE